MRLANQICTVEILIDDAYRIESPEKQQYDIIWNPSLYDVEDLSKTLSIAVDLGDRAYRIALIGSIYSRDDDCAVLEENTLLVLQNDTITKINLYDGSLLLHKNLNCFGCNFGVYRVNDGYILYGEIEITMLDMELNPKWSFSGRDIFVSRSEEESFVICDDGIELYDWQGNFYKIDFGGTLILDKPAAK